MLISLYVDDMLISANDSGTIAQIKEKFSRRYEMKDLGEASGCLGLDIHRNRTNRTLHLSQISYTDTVLERFGMHTRKPVATPMETSSSKTHFHGDQDPAEDIPYRQAIRSLMYLMVRTRPDLEFVVGRLSQYCEKPLSSHWIAVERVLLYIYGTRDRSIQYGTSQIFDHGGYSDYDWGGCLETRKSTSRYVYLHASGPVSWRSRKKTDLAPSSGGPEYIASSMTTNEALWLSRLVCDITGIPIQTQSQFASTILV